VQEEHLDGRVVADPLGPDAKGPLGRFHRNHLHATAEDVVDSLQVLPPD